MKKFAIKKGRQGQVLEWRMQSEKTYENPYIDISVWALFRHESGREYKRPAFWDGGRTWRIRFAIPETTGTIHWESFSDGKDPGLKGKKGEISCAQGRSNLLSISKGKRNIVDPGGKGKLLAAGQVMDAQDYCRYCRYLVARYGAWPAIYLVGADGTGKEPGVRAAGREMEAWDCYHQPTGMHYNPMTPAKQWQADKWLDFQWCQSGHKGEHRPDLVADMCRNDRSKGWPTGNPLTNV